MRIGTNQQWYQNGLCGEFSWYMQNGVLYHLIETFSFQFFRFPGKVKMCRCVESMHLLVTLSPRTCSLP